MIQIKKAILHILDFSHSSLILSETSMDDDEIAGLHFVSKQIEKLLESPMLKKGTFMSNSLMEPQVQSYANESVTLETISATLADDWYRLVKLSDKIDSSCLLVCEAYDNAKRLLVALKYKSRNAFMYSNSSKDGKLCNTVIENMSILPGANQAIDECFFINLDSMEIMYKDIKRIIETQESYIIPERLLFCSSELSQKEILTTVKDLSEELAGEYDLDTVGVAAKTKVYIQDKLADDGYFRLEEMAEEVFTENPKIGEEFVTIAQDKHIPEEIRMHTKYAASTSQTQNMKTDTGIKVTIPTIYYEDPEHFEIIHNEDGTLTLQIKNVLYIK